LWFVAHVEQIRQHSSRKLNVRDHLRDLGRRREDNMKMAVVYLAQDMGGGGFCEDGN
jgi:hypothetical protein